MAERDGAGNGPARGADDAPLVELSRACSDLGGAIDRRLEPLQRALGKRVAHVLLLITQLEPNGPLTIVCSESAYDDGRRVPDLLRVVGAWVDRQLSDLEN